MAAGIPTLAEAVERLLWESYSPAAEHVCARFHGETAAQETSQRSFCYRRYTSNTLKIFHPEKKEKLAFM